jgi:2-iminobutanoate/2-iminopropanoate deaminase
MKIIETKNAPKAVGPYSQAILIKDTLYVSGQLPFDPKTNQLISDDISLQTKMCLNNILGVVEEAGFKKENIVKCSVYMTDLNQFSLMNSVYEAFFLNHKTARVTIEVRRLPKDVLIEIDAIAVSE